MTGKTANFERRLQLRVPGDLHKQLDRSAQKAGRSLNSEMVHRLTESFARSDEPVMRSEFKAVTSSIASSSANQAVDEVFRRLKEAGVELPQITRGSGDH